ncbi:MAG: ATP-binding protein [Rikenellaceae bacterium]
MKIPKAIHRRDAYIDRIAPFINKGVVKVMVGHRRVGKSYILFQLMEVILAESSDANIIYINKEDVAFDHINDYKQLNDYILSKSTEGQKNYIFIDEIQNIEDFHKAIRSLALDENNDIYITGSNSQMFSSDLANEMGGRYIEFTIYSLSYIEFLSFHNLPNNNKSLDRYMRYGGLPYLIHLPSNDEVIVEYLKSIYSTIVLRDVVQRKNIRNSIFLEQLIRFLADNVGSLFSSKSISDYLKSQRVEMSSGAVNDYAVALSQAFVVHRVGRYDIVGKRLFERGEKYYFEDMGIRNVVAGYKPQDRAKRLENVVYNHLLYSGYEVKVGAMQSEEIDFVCTKGGETLYVQVTQELFKEETIAREFGNLLNIKDNYPKIVVSADESYENSYEGVKHIYIRDFLSSLVEY